METGSKQLAVSFDPGVANLGVAGVVIMPAEGGRPRVIELVFGDTFNITKGPSVRSPDIGLLSAVMSEIEERVHSMETAHGTRAVWVLEYQPPLGTRSNPGLVRANTWVEAFIETYCWLKGKPYRRVAPSAVKRAFWFPVAERGRQYKSNKASAVRIARDLVGPQAPSTLNDHVADCVLNAIYALSKNFCSK
jgi:hypothetical protein